jgi:hypothetical protein
MWRLIGVVSLLMAWASPADACTVAPTYDPSKAFERRTRGDIVKMTEIIVEGVVEPPAEPAGPGPENRLSFSRMHIDRVWKGAIASDVVVLTRIGIGTVHGRRHSGSESSSVPAWWIRNSSW